MAGTPRELIPLADRAPGHGVGETKLWCLFSIVVPPHLTLVTPPNPFPTPGVSGGGAATCGDRAPSPPQGLKHRIRIKYFEHSEPCLGQGGS